MICVSPRELETVMDILRRHASGCLVRVFGSRSKCTNRDHSDLDLAIELRDGEKLSLAQLGGIADAFEESDLPYRVDVTDYNAASPEFKKIIDAGCEILDFEEEVIA